MDKINNVTFTGVSNIARCEFARVPRSISRSLSMILKDDYNGKDLNEFRSVVKKITDNSSYYINESVPNSLNIEAFTESGSTALFVNGTYLELNDKNLPMFSYLAKVTRNIANMPKKQMVVNNDYVEFEAKNLLVAGGELKSEKPEYLLPFFDKNKVKEAAQDMNDFIQMIMEKYLGIR